MKSRNTRETVSQENNFEHNEFEYREYPNIPSSVTLLKEHQNHQYSVSNYKKKHDSKSATCVSEKSTTFKTFGSSKTLKKAL